MLEIVDAIFNWLWNEIQTNDMFTGLVGATLLTGVGYLFRNLPSKFIKGLISTFSTSFEIYNDEAEYYMILKKLEDNWWVKKLSRHIRYEKGFSKEISYNYDGKNEESELVVFGLGYGKHFLIYNLVPILVVKEKVDTHTKEVVDKLSFTFYTRNKNIVRSWFDGIVIPFKEMDKKLEVRTYRGWWGRALMRNLRDLDQVILPEDQKNRIVEDMEKFWANKLEYVKRGIPYRRGYLFHGLAGTGKTSICAALSSYFKKDLYLLNINNCETDKDLENAFSTMAPNSIVLMEDIDAVGRKSIVSRADTPEITSSNTDVPKSDTPVTAGVTLQGLLNAIDGILSVEDRILIMTTNYKEKLDPALIRDGRVDLKEEFCYFDQSLVEQMVTKFYLNQPVDVELVAKEIMDGKELIAPCAVQNKLLQRNDFY